MLVRLFDQVVGSSHIEPKSTKFNDLAGDDYFIKSTEEIFLFRTGGGGGGRGEGEGGVDDLYMVLPLLQSTRKDCRQDSEDYLNSGHTLL